MDPVSVGTVEPGTESEVEISEVLSPGSGGNADVARVCRVVLILLCEPASVAVAIETPEQLSSTKR